MSKYLGLPVSFSLYLSGLNSLFRVLWEQGSGVVPAAELLRQYLRSVAKTHLFHLSSVLSSVTFTLLINSSYSLKSHPSLSVVSCCSNP